MKTWLIGIGVALATAALGVGAAYGAGQLIRTVAPAAVQPDRPVRFGFGADSFRQDMANRRAGDRRTNERAGRMNPWIAQGLRDRMQGGTANPQMPQGLRDRIQDWREDLREEPLDAAAALILAEQYAAGMGDGLRVARLVEFERVFYAVVEEAESGRGAITLLIGKRAEEAVVEPGPARMWNVKYGPGCLMAGTSAAEETALALQDARAAAEKALAATLPNASLGEGGTIFYGYFTFDYLVDGKLAGTISVNGYTGQVWTHTGYGAFVAEAEVSQ